MRRQPRATLGRGGYDDTAQESDRSLSGGALHVVVAHDPTSHGVFFWVPCF